jgi:hypothetical protein
LFHEETVFDDSSKKYFLFLSSLPTTLHETHIPMSTESPEELIHTATALFERARGKILTNTVTGQEQKELLIGFRVGGEASIYLPHGLACHFNSAGELRRAFYGDLLYKAVHGDFVAIERQPGGLMVLNDSSGDRQHMIMSVISSSLCDIKQCATAGEIDWIDCRCNRISEGISPELLPGKINDWLCRLSLPPIIARSPRVDGKPVGRRRDRDR